MKKFITLNGLILVSALAQTSQAQDVSRAKAAELSLHRVERLVILKKIDDAYQSKFLTLALKDAGAGAPEGSKFLATIKKNCRNYR